MAQQDTNSNGAKEFTELDWIALKNDLGTAQTQAVETSTSKFYRKFYENPFVPIGKCRKLLLPLITTRPVSE